MNRLKLASIVVALGLSFTGKAQKTQVYTEPDAEFKLGVELFQKEKFGAAQKSFAKTLESHPDPNSLVHIDAEYYRAICAVELFNRDGELYLKEFIANHPESPKVKTAYFYLGKYNYFKKKWKDAIDWFNKVDIYDLTTDELAELYFKRGYSYFITDKSTEAKKDLNEIKDVDNKYAGAAKYYYAHIAYMEKNYETALPDFQKLQRNETFGPIVPYYIAQIFYLQAKYDSVISYAPALLDSANTKRAPEIARVLGEAYYRKDNYKAAIPYLLQYKKAAGELSRKDNFEMGYAFYKIKNYDEALNYFVKITNIDDSLVQSGYYHMGDCYLKLDDKPRARNAFSQAAKLDFDKSIQEDALFNYAKLSYELAYNPYNDAIKAFQKYIQEFPNSGRVDEAYTYLVNVFTTTKNYKEALAALESIKVLTPELKQAHQKIAFYRGVDLFNNQEYAEAVKLFDKALTYTFDRGIRASAIYWRAEAFYRQKNYESAIDNYQQYILEPGAINKMEMSDANYNIGYAYFKEKDYTNSILWFRKFVVFKPQADQKKINDALNRIGDGYFMNRDFSNAVDYYAQAYKMKLINPDYSLFQKALANGVQKKYKEKISDLNTFVNEYGKTSSIYVQRAKFELALTYSLDNQTDLALNSFKKFVDEYPASLYVNTALSKIALIYYARRDDDNALAYFDKLIKRDRKSPEANEAINTVKNIYTAKGNVQAMEDYMASVGAAIPQASLDSISYGIGKTHYLEQNCKSVVSDFAQYLQKFPEGIFATEANYYKAECETKLGNTENALAAYMAVVSRPKSTFTEQSLVQASEIQFKKADYAKALELYQQLVQQAEDAKNFSSARIGVMRCNYQLKNYDAAISGANDVLAIEKLSKALQDEAHDVIAQSLLATEKYDDAYAAFKALANTSKSEIGAGAGYQVANLLYRKSDYAGSQKAVFDLINGDGDFPYWVTKALLLLADDYIGLNDNFQAKTTLKSIISDSDIPEFIKVAQEKLDKIVADEEAAKQAKTMTAPVNVEFDGNTTEQNKLFTEPVTTEPEGGNNHE